MNTPIIRENNWKIKQLIFFQILLACMIFSFFWPATRSFWQAIDIWFFKTLNGSLEGRPLWQVFWALANHRMADWVEDVCILGFFIAYVRSAGKVLRTRKVSQLAFCILYIAAILYFFNRVLLRHTVNIPRESPTLVLESSIRLSQEVPWLHIKVDSSKSFPGDHGTTALLFAASYFYFAGWRLGIFAALYAAFLCIPRLITGAHWLSDVIVGSGSIAIFFLSWAFCTPLHSWVTDQFEKFFNTVSALARKWCTI